MSDYKYILKWDEISHDNVPEVGGKNASLGEMYNNLSSQGVPIPYGFATTSEGYFHFLEEAGLKSKIAEILSDLDVEDIKSLQKKGKKIRKMIRKASLPDDFRKEVISAYHDLAEHAGEENLDVAVRSSATAEDLPNASFAGQQDTFLNIRGEKNLIKATKGAIASLFTDRAISYREEKGFDHEKVALSVGIQKMVRSDLASSGVMFTLDTETGFSNVVLINSVWGVGELLVQGETPGDEFNIFKPTLKEGYKPVINRDIIRQAIKKIYNKKGGLKTVKVAEEKQTEPSLTEEEALKLAQWAVKIEDYYTELRGHKSPQDIEWAKDGKTGQLYIVQARPETIYRGETDYSYEEYSINTDKEPLIKELAIGDKIGRGKINVIKDVKNMSKFKEGQVLVTGMTDPDWVSIMKKASAIITDKGSRVCHAAIVSRELGIPAIVGTERATEELKSGQEVVVDCTQGSEGRVFPGSVDFKVKKYDLKKVPEVSVDVAINIGAPDKAFKNSFLPAQGAGLVREEFVIAQDIKIHPLALYNFDQIEGDKLKEKINKLTFGYDDKKEYFIEKLSEGVGKIAASFYPDKVIVRLSDFKTNEYRELIGGGQYEPEENNPMLGWRGASRYYSPEFKPAFQMECQALKRAREKFGLKNIVVMVPFCRTPEEGRKVLDLMAEFGLEKGKDGLEVYMMAEVPSNVILAEEFLKDFDGFSIGTNDLTQLTLGLDRDSAFGQEVGDERNEAVKKSISRLIKICREKDKYVGICGQAPSDYPDFAFFLAEEGINTISVTSDMVIKTILNLADQGFKK